MAEPKLIDYTNFDYKKKFWEDADRKYEDFCDRLALRRLLPKTGEKFVDVCGGFGRLADEYLHRYKEVSLFDYAQNLLEQARAAHGDKLKTVQGSVYALPFAKDEFDALICIRASHHLADLAKAVAELARVLKPGGQAIIEIANKRNILEILRWLGGRSKMRPFSLSPADRNGKGFYNFHPRYVREIFRQNNFKIKKVLGVSNFRIGFLKKLGAPLLCFAERLTQGISGRLKLSPSLYYLLEKTAR